MPAALSNSQTVTFSNVAVPLVTQASVSESATQIDVSSLSQATDTYRDLVAGLRDAAEVSITSLNGSVGAAGANGALTVGSLSFSAATVMSTEVAYRVGETIAYTTTLRATA